MQALAEHIRNLNTAPWLNRETRELCELLLKAYFERAAQVAASEPERLPEHNFVIETHPNWSSD